MPPPGEGLETVIRCHPNAVKLAAETMALSCVPLSTVVGSGAPSNWIAEPAPKPVPVTVIAVSLEPARTAAGVMELMVGATV